MVMTEVKTNKPIQHGKDEKTMNNYSININSVEPGAQVFLNGIVDYSRIASHIDGEELAADNARKLAKGMRAIEKPHTRLVLSHCKLEYANPAAPTTAEKFIAERLYRSTAHPDKEDCFTAMNKSRNLPNLYCRDNAVSKQLEPAAPTAELAAGTPVTVALRFFSTNQNSGVSLDTVIVNQKPIKWNAGFSAAALAERGFEIVAPADASVDDIRAQLDAPVETAVPPTPAPYMQPAAAPSAIPAAYAQPAPEPTLPIPPKGYVYDENKRLVPESAVQGGIRL